MVPLAPSMVAWCSFQEPTVNLMQPRPKAGLWAEITTEAQKTHLSHVTSILMEEEFRQLAEKLCKEKACRIQRCLQGEGRGGRCTGSSGRFQWGFFNLSPFSLQ